MNHDTSLATLVPRLNARRGIYEKLLICWAINAFFIIIDIMLLNSEHISFIDSDRHYYYHLIGFLCFAWMVGVAMIWVPMFSRIGRRAAWFLHLHTMNLVFSVGSVVLTYLVAEARLPLVDGALHQGDLALGFHWHAFSYWVESRPILASALRLGYNSLIIQGILVIFFLIAEDEEGQAVVFSLTTMICALITTAIFVALPALGYSGEIGRAHVLALIHARRHALSAVSTGTMTGIVTFPSFHAAMGGIIAYTMRTRLWRAIVFIPLNLLMITATMPMGGHYLIDTISGCALAGIVLYGVAKCSPGSGDTADLPRAVA